MVVVIMVIMLPRDACTLNFHVRVRHELSRHLLCQHPPTIFVPKLEFSLWVCLPQ